MTTNWNRCTCMYGAMQHVGTIRSSSKEKFANIDGVRVVGGKSHLIDVF
jgi:hypothetical protein